VDRILDLSEKQPPYQIDRPFYEAIRRVKPS
jgi:hypothetical protein